MSEKKSNRPDRTALYIAILGASATVIAALIGVVPIFFGRNDPTPTAIIITATPAPTAIAQATQIPPTATALPIAPTLPPTAVPPPASPTNDERITLLLVNNLNVTVDFFIDQQIVTAISSGTYKPLRVARGTHSLRRCVDSKNPATCDEKVITIENEPQSWILFDDTNPLVASSDVVFLILNQLAFPVDAYVDDKLVSSIAAKEYSALTIPRGRHTLQPCPRGIIPSSGQCGTRREILAQTPTITYSIFP